MRIKLTNARLRVTTKSDLHSGGGYTNTLAWIESACTFKLGVNLYARVDGHKSTSSSVRKHYHNGHAGAPPEDLLSCFKVLKKCMNKFDCLVNEMLYIKQLTPSLNVPVDSILAKVFV